MSDKTERETEPRSTGELIFGFEHLSFGGWQSQKPIQLETSMWQATLPRVIVSGGGVCAILDDWEKALHVDQEMGNGDRGHFRLT